MSNPGAQFFLFFDTILVLKQLVVITRTKAFHSVKKTCMYILETRNKFDFKNVPITFHH